MQENITDLSSLKLDLSSFALQNLTDYAIKFGKNIVAAILVYIIGRFIIRKISVLVSRILVRRNVEQSLQSFINSLVSVTLNFLMIIVIIGILGIETSSFLALFASAGVAIGMALSGTLQNFAGGVMILLNKPYKIGDVIEAEGYTGCVKDILIFNTVLTTPDNQTIIIPNGGLSTGKIKNFSTASQRRVDIPVEVAYGTSSQEVRDVLMEIVSQDSRILKGQGLEASIPMTTMASSSIVFEVRVWVDSADYWAVKFDLTEKIYSTLQERNIEIPFQQMDVHIRQ